jgi:4-aminobutyrate aminotransferase
MILNKKNVNLFKELIISERPLNIVVDRIEEDKFIDVEGNQYMDLTSGYGVVNIGWKNKQLLETIHQQTNKMAFSPPWLATNEAIDLANTLISISPNSLKKCCKTLSGTDANETIFKAINCYTEKKGVISYNYSYHGGLHFALSLSDSLRYKFPKHATSKDIHLVDPPYCYRCKYNKTPDTCNLECMHSILQLLETRNDISSICIEPILGSAGVIIPPVAYYEQLKEICNQYNIFMVVDEVLTGFGRIGKMTACALYNINPAAISYGKGISSGYIAISAALLNAKLSDALSNYEDVSSSLSWSPLACKVAKANIDIIIKNNLCTNAAIMGFYFLENLKELFIKYCYENIGEVRGIGLLIGVEIVKTKLCKEEHPLLVKKFIITALKKGLFVCASWDFSTIIFMPVLSITRKEINHSLKIIEEVLITITRNRVSY